MNANELSNEIKRSIWERQNGMCAFTGKKFEDFNNLVEADFVLINPNNNQSDAENIVMIWKKHSGIPSEKLKKYLFPYANFLNYTVDEKAKEFKLEIDEAIALSNNTTNYRESENQIRDIANTLKTLGLTKTQKDEFSELLHTALTTVLQKRNEEFEKNKSSWQINYDTVKPKLHEIVEFAKNATIFKEAKEKLIEIQKEIKELAISRDHRSEFEKTLKDAFENLNAKHHEFMENFEMECIENYHNIKTKFDETIHKVFSLEAFPEAQKLLIEMQNIIKEKTLKRKQKDEFFETIRKTFDELREKFVEYKLVSAEEAAENYAIVKPKVDEAIEFALANITVAQANEAREKLLEAIKSVKDTRLKREQKDELFKAIREVFKKINDVVTEERNRFAAEASSNFDTVLSKIEVVIVDIENAIDLQYSGDTLSAIRTEIQLLKLKIKQRNKLYDRLRFAFDLLAKQREEYFKRKFAERIGNLEDTYKNFEMKNSRTNNLLAKDREILKEQENKLAGTSEENVHMKNSIIQVIAMVNKRISDRENFIYRTEKKIEGIKKEIEKIKKREEERINSASKRNSKSNNETDETNNSEVAETTVTVETVSETVPENNTSENTVEQQ